MPRKLEVYTVSHDGRNRRMVAADSKREAARLMGVSEHAFRQYSMAAGIEADKRLALRSPGTVFERACTSRSTDDWKATAVVPYEPRRVPAKWLAEELEKLPREPMQLIPEREFTVKGKPMVDLADTVMEHAAGLRYQDVRAVLAVLDDIGAGLVVPNRPQPSGDVIERSKRILALVDDYHDKPTADTRSALRHALHDEFSSLLQPVSKKD